VSFQLGAYQFVSARGQVPHPRNRIERLTRNGVNYARYRRLGYGTDPFRLQTRVNVASIAEGRTTMTGYTALVGAGAQTLIWAGHNVDVTDNFDCHVLDVSVDRLGAVNQWCGSLDDNDTYELVVTWTLELKA